MHTKAFKYEFFCNNRIYICGCSICADLVPSRSEQAHSVSSTLHIYTHTCLHIYTHTCLHIYTHTCLHRYKHVVYVFMQQVIFAIAATSYICDCRNKLYLRLPQQVIFAIAVPLPIVCHLSSMQRIPCQACRHTCAHIHRETHTLPYR